MRYQVPQFIEVEDKIFGPLTFKQFAYVAGGASLCFILYKFIPSIFIAAIFMVPVGAFSLALAFFKVNNRPFIDTVEAAFRYFLGSKLYIWRKVDKPHEETAKEIAEKAVPTLYVPRLSDSKLKDLAWSLDINETIYQKSSGKLEKGHAMNDKFKF
jgi:hypothetical protein